METLAGNASAVTHSATPYGEYGERMLHVAMFRLDGVHQVRLELPRKPAIENGDLIAVASISRGSLLNALAYENLSAGKSDNSDKYEFLLGGIGILVFAIWWASGHVAALAGLLGVWLLFRSVRIAIAVHDLRYEVSRHQARSRSQGTSPLGDA